MKNLPAFKIKPNATVDRELRVRKAVKIEEASHKLNFLGSNK